jgi:Family of unknown function (DUF6035)
MAGKNVTRSADELATPAKQLAIGEIQNLITGKIFDARTFIATKRYASLMRLRGLIAEWLQLGQPRYGCSVCGVPVKIVAQQDKTFFFRHDIEDGSCPAITRGALSEDEINERKYKGLQEGLFHKRCKATIEACLKRDPNFTDVLVEKTWRSSRDPKLLKRPDVSATNGALKVVFEIQLSTTFLSVVAKRRTFYQTEGALLCWVFDQFDPYDRRMTADDILFSNNSNVFVVDAETRLASENEGVLVLKVHYIRYSALNGNLKATWETQLCRWSELIKDIVHQQVYFFDSDTSRQNTVLAIEADKKRVLEAEIEKRARIIAETEQRLLEVVAAEKRNLQIEIIKSIESDLQHVKPARRKDYWSGLQSQALRYGVNLENDFGPDGDLRKMVVALLCAQNGSVVVWKFKNMQSVANHVAQHAPYGFHLFMKMLNISGHIELLESLASHSPWRKKRLDLQTRYRQRDPILLVPKHIAETVAFLFPELPPAITSFPAQSNNSFESRK